jgi:hypothetical protein
MPTYVIGGKRIQTEQPLTDTQIEEIAVDLGVAPAPQAQAQPQASAPTSGFLMGLKDPISGGAQLLERILPEPVVKQVNKLNQVLAEYGLVSKLPEGGVSQMVREEEQAYQAGRAQRGEEGFDVGRLGGNIVSGVLPGAAATRLAGTGLRGAAVSGGATAALQPVTQGQEEDFATEKAKQVAGGAAFGVAGQKVLEGAGTALNPLLTKAEQTMRDLGIKGTVGQKLGEPAKAIEEFAQNLPIVGTAIQSQREKTLYNFNKAIINKALDKVNIKLPADAIGRDAVQFATDRVNEAYDDVLSKMSFSFTPTVSSDILNALNKATLPSPAQRQIVEGILNNVVLDKVPPSGVLTGEAIKGIESDLRKQAIGYLSSSTQNDRSIGDALQLVLRELKKNIYDQNQKLTPQLRRIDSAYGDLAVMKMAAANTGAQSGVFTPKQYQQAVRQADQSRRKARFAEGRARGQKEAEAAMEMIGETPGAVLEGRLAGLAKGGALFGMFGYDPVAATALTGSTRLLYSDMGQEIADLILRSRTPLMRKAGEKVTKAATPVGAPAGAGLLTQYNIATQVEEEQ